jgi:hypothetical protein
VILCRKLLSACCCCCCCCLRFNRACRGMCCSCLCCRPWCDPLPQAAEHLLLLLQFTLPPRMRQHALQLPLLRTTELSSASDAAG